MYVEKCGDEVWVGVKSQSNTDIAGSLRNSFWASLKGCKYRSEEHTSELQSRFDLVCRLLLEKKKRRGAHPPPAAGAGLPRRPPPEARTHHPRGDGCQR